MKSQASDANAPRARVSNALRSGPMSPGDLVVVMVPVVVAQAAVVQAIVAADK